jgi:2-oxoglutarate ferredoxin oxidoreductase subunit beta
VYVARWTTYHVRQLAKSMNEALQKRGFRFIEIISPCPTLYQRRNRLGDGLDAMKYYKEKSVIKHGADTRGVGITFQGEIVCGKFIDRERETWLDAYNRVHQAKLGSRFKPYPQAVKA